MPKNIRKGDTLVPSGFVGYVQKGKNQKEDPLEYLRCISLVFSFIYLKNNVRRSESDLKKIGHLDITS